MNNNPPKRRRALSPPGRWLVAGIAILLIAVGALLIWRMARQRPASRANPFDARQVALGQQIYAAQCASCHGANLQGQPNWQTELPTGGRVAPPHDASGHTWHHDDALLFNIIKKGKDAMRSLGNYKYNMPAFGEKLTDEEIRAALAFIKSRWPAEILKSQLKRSRSSGIRTSQPEGRNPANVTVTSRRTAALDGRLLAAVRA